MSSIKHVCLDFDGTIVDQVDAYYLEIEKSFRKRNLEVPPRELWQQAQWLDDFSVMHEYGDDQEMWFEITDAYCRTADNLMVFPEAIAFMLFSAENSIPLTLATGRTANKEELKKITDELGITEFFKAQISYGETDFVKVVQARDVDKSPLFNAMCEAVNVPIVKSWYVTDIAHDAHNALEVGFETVFGVPTGGINPALFSSEVKVISSLAELIPLST